MKYKQKYTILLIIFILCFIASAILSFIPTEEACGGTDTSCYIVNSEYVETIGIKNCYFGLIAFSVLIILTICHILKPKKYKKQLILISLIIGSVFAVYFIYLQFIVIQACCQYCMVVDMGTLLGLAIALFWKEK